MPYDELDDSSRTSLRRVSVMEVDDKGTQQKLKLSGLKGEELHGVVRSQHYGFSSVPPKGGEGVLLEGGGRADRAHVLALEHKKFRPVNRKPGESVLYDNLGQEVYVSQSGIKVTSGKKKLPLTVTVGDSVVTITEDSITLKSKKIILEGTVYLGSKDAKNEVAMKGTVDTAGASDIKNLATKAFVK